MSAIGHRADTPSCASTVSILRGRVLALSAYGEEGVSTTSILRGRVLPLPAYCVGGC